MVETFITIIESRNVEKIDILKKFDKYINLKNKTSLKKWEQNLKFYQVGT